MNNEAQFGVRFAVKNAKQVQKQMDAINARLKRMGVSAEQTGKKLDQTTKGAEQTGKKQERVFESGSKKANEMSKSLDRVVKKWLSIGGAVTLVATIIRRAFAKVDEITGLRAMATSAGVAASRIESLGKKLKAYGGDASSAAGAYTSLGDILGAARSGRGISQDVVTASSRYGIALNGGMLTEEQLMTNIARAMQVQRKRGNMYGVRDIASAFGIDEPMMLHLSQAGANWDRGLPAANLAAKQAEAAKVKELQGKLDNLVDKFLSEVIPILIPALEGILDVVNWIKSLPAFNKGKEVVPTTPKKFELDTAHASSYEQGLYEFNKSQGMSDSEARELAKKTMFKAGYPVQGYQDELLAKRMQYAQEWADKYNTTPGVDMMKALANVRNTLGEGGNANLVFDRGRLQIVIEDKAGVLRGTKITASSNEFGSVAVNTATSGK